MATATEVKRGFNVACIHCGEAGTVRVDLTGLDLFTCSGCDNEFGIDEVREHLQKWSKVLQWIDKAPILEDE